MYKRLLLITALCMSMVAVFQPVPKAWGQFFDQIGVNFNCPSPYCSLTPASPAEWYAWLTQAAPTASPSELYASFIPVAATASPSGMLLAKRPPKEDPEDRLLPYNVDISTLIKKAGNVTLVPKFQNLTACDIVVNYQCVNWGGQASTMNVNSALLPLALYDSLPITEDMVSKNGKAALDATFYFFDTGVFEGYADEINELLPKEGEYFCADKPNWDRLGELFEFREFNLKALVESWTCKDTFDCKKDPSCTFADGSPNPVCYDINPSHTIGIKVLFDGVDADYWKICDSLDDDFEDDCSNLCPSS